MTTTGVGARIAEAIAAGGVGALFGVPGGQTLPLYAASGAAGLRHVVMRDERNAVCAADAYARLTGRVGVCDATVGPGVTNLVSGLAEAYAASVPVLAIAADIRTDQEHLRRRSVVSQALDQRALLVPITKWVGRVERAAALDDVLAHALRVATTGRPGPVVLEVPEDVFFDDVSGDSPRSFSPDDWMYPRHRPAPPPELVRAAAELLASAERPIILAGGGVLLGGAADAVSALAEKTGIPVVTTINGKGSIDERSPLAGGVVGVFGRPGASVAMQRADVVLVLGSKLDQITTHRWRLPTPGQRLIHVDIDGEEIGRVMPPVVAIVADAGAMAAALAATLGGPVAAAGWLASLQGAEPPPPVTDDPGVAPEEVVAAVSDALVPGDVVVCDASLASGWGAAHIRLPGAGRFFVAPRGLAGIGWSPGAALGARLATDAARRVVVLVGDGAWSYGMGEIETAARVGMDITYVVLNNSTLGWIQHTETSMGIASSSAFGTVDFAGAARCLGGDGAVVGREDDLGEAVRQALSATGPFLLDVRSSALATPVVSLSRLRGAAV